MVEGVEGTIRLRPPVHRVERRAMAWWAVQPLAYLGPVAGGLAILYALVEPTRPWLQPVFWLLAIWFVLATFVEPWWRFAVHRWEVTDEAVYALSGWFVREWRVAPLSRIQTVDTVQGPLQQLFGLATLRVTTASSQGAIEIAGLDKATAAEAAERLTEITQRTPGDAT